MKNYKKPIAAWLGLAVLSMFSMTSTGADSFELQEPILLSDPVATSSDAVMKTEEILETVEDEIEEIPIETGWNNTENGFTYISATGEPLIETWITDEHGRYYLGKNGIMFFDGVRKIKDHNYCFDETGNVQVGRFWYDGIEYYAASTGQLYSDEWIKDDDDNWLYIAETGEIMKDSITPDGYLLDMDGQIITEEDELSQAFSYVSSNSRRELILKAKTGQIIWDFLKENGWTDTAIAGVLGNFQQEGGLTADMHQKGGGTGYGLGQWTGDRRYALEAYAESTGQDVTQIMTQLNYLLIEPGEQSFINKYAKTEHDSPSEAALAWARGWERYNEDGSIYRVRIPYAEAYYAYFVNGEDFVIAKEPDYIMEASETEVFASSAAEDIMMTMLADTTSESVSVSESVEESTEGYGPAFDPKLNQELTAADTESSMEDENVKGLTGQDTSQSLLAEESLEGFVEEETEKESEVTEETHPENYGPGYTTEASSETENQETIEESLQ